MWTLVLQLGNVIAFRPLARYLFGDTLTAFAATLLFQINPFVFFERTFNPVHVIALSIGQRGNYPVIAMSLGAKHQVRNPGHHFTNAELAHRLLPPPHLLITASASVATATKRGSKRDYFKTSKTKASKCLPPCSPCADELIE